LYIELLITLADKVTSRFARTLHTEREKAVCLSCGKQTASQGVLGSIYLILLIQLLLFFYILVFSVILLRMAKAACTTASTGTTAGAGGLTFFLIDYLFHYNRHKNNCNYSCNNNCRKIYINHLTFPASADLSDTNHTSLPMLCLLRILIPTEQQPQEHKHNHACNRSSYVKSVSGKEHAELVYHQ